MGALSQSPDAISQHIYLAKVRGQGTYTTSLKCNSWIPANPKEHRGLKLELVQCMECIIVPGNWRYRAMKGGSGEIPIPTLTPLLPLEQTQTTLSHAVSQIVVTSPMIANDTGHGHHQTRGGERKTRR